MSSSLFRTSGGALVTAGVVAVCVSVAGQQVPVTPPAPTQQPKQQRPVFRAGANLVRVDVTVTTRGGEPVTDLQPEDFIVSEDGYPQEIQTFEFVRATGAPLDDRSLPIRSPQHAAYEASRDDVRLFLIFWDEYHIGQFIPALRGRETLTEFVRTAFGPTDLVGIMDQLTTVDSIRFTRDWNALVEQIRNLKGRMGIYVPTRSAIEDAHLQVNRDIPRIRNEITMTALRSAAAFLGNFREGRKVLLFVSQGVAIYGRDSESLFYRELVETANQNNTAIYTLDPGSQVGRTPGSLMSIANDTGGKAFVGTNAPAKLLPQMVEDSSAYYLIGYVSNRDPADGQFHKINVRLRKKGYDVRGRTGYFAPARDAVEKARAAAEASALPPAFDRAIGDLEAFSRQERAASVWVGMARGTEGRTAITLAWLPRPASTDPPRQAATTLTVNATGGGTATYFDDRLPDGGVARFEASPGELTLRLAALGASGEELDGELRRVAVPSLTGDRVALGTPVVYRARTALEVRRIQEGSDLRPEVSREFARTDRVFIRFPMYGPGSASAHLLNRLGTRMRQIPLKPLADGTYEIDLPLVAMVRGDYLISIDASDGTAAAREVIALRIK